MDNTIKLLWVGDAVFLLFNLFFLLVCIKLLNRTKRRMPLERRKELADWLADVDRRVGQLEKKK